jgi:hypothetical protein
MRLPKENIPEGANPAVKAFSNSKFPHYRKYRLLAGEPCKRILPIRNHHTSFGKYSWNNKGISLRTIRSNEKNVNNKKSAPFHYLKHWKEEIVRDVDAVLAARRRRSVLATASERREHVQTEQEERIIKTK